MLQLASYTMSLRCKHFDMTFCVLLAFQQLVPLPKAVPQNALVQSPVNC